jgi:hypothetical protein
MSDRCRLLSAGTDRRYFRHMALRPSCHNASSSVGSDGRGSVGAVPGLRPAAISRPAGVSCHTPRTGCQASPWPVSDRIARRTVRSGRHVCSAISSVDAVASSKPSRAMTTAMLRVTGDSWRHRQFRSPDRSSPRLRPSQEQAQAFERIEGRREVGRPVAGRMRTHHKTREPGLVHRPVA